MTESMEVAKPFVPAPRNPVLLEGADFFDQNTLQHFDKGRKHITNELSAHYEWKACRRIIGAKESKSDENQKFSRRKIDPDSARDKKPSTYQRRHFLKGEDSIDPDCRVFDRKKHTADGVTREQSDRSWSVESTIGRKKTVSRDGMRNNIGTANPGDDPYNRVEDSPNYFGASSSSHTRYDNECLIK